MDKLNFDCLKNIDVPEKWIENALNSPEEKRAHNIQGRFFHICASAAACAVIAVAVAFSLIFGLNSDADLTNPNPGSAASSKSELVTAASGYTAESKTEPQTKALQLYKDTQNPTVKTEPAESGIDIIQKSSQPVQKPQNSSQDGTKASAQSQTEANGKTEQPAAADSEKTEPATQTCADVTTHISTCPPVMSGCSFETSVSAALAEGNVYFRMEDENGVIFGDKGLFDDYRLVNKSAKNNSEVKLSYTLSQPEAEKADGKIFTIIFYKADGEVIKSITVPVIKELYLIFR